ncbi:MAG: beta-aspartyl-peptidase [Proteobacteria bacterium]|nr:beta-aspartyl-peptidase [Pseudomonadota bacterium]
MITLIRNVQVFAPEDRGAQDVVILGDRIVAIGGDLTKWTEVSESQVIEGKGRYLVPGFIDQHVHLLGGGGAAGFGSRGPETAFSEAVLAGTTTVVGCVGVDQEGRDLKELYAKTKSLEVRGLTARMYTGGFDMRITLTGSLKSDLFLIDNVIGSKVAVSDRRSVQPTHDELKRVFAETIVGGLSANKAGVVHIHMGDQKTGLTPVMRAWQEVEMPIRKIVPTHLNRNAILMEQGLDWAMSGGLVDFTPSITPGDFKEAKRASEAVGIYLSKGVPIDQITLSTDANGVFTIHGFDKMFRVPMTLLQQEFQDLVLVRKLSMTDALRCVSTNVADILRLSQKGRIAEGADADMLLLDPETLDVDVVMARGIVVVDEKKFISRQKLDV